MDFGKLFIHSKGGPIQYNGREIFMIDTVQCARGENIFRLTFDETNSNWKQGVRLNVNGFFEIDSKKVKSKAILWQDTAPGMLEFKVFTKEGFFMCITPGIQAMGQLMLGITEQQCIARIYLTVNVIIAMMVIQMMILTI